MRFYPEGRLIDTPENRAALRSPAALAEAIDEAGDYSLDAVERDVA